MYLLEYSIICLPNIVMGRSESEDMEFYKLIEGDQKKSRKKTTLSYYPAECIKMSLSGGPGLELPIASSMSA